MKGGGRFVDPRLSIYSLMDEIIVVCPQCEQSACVFLKSDGEKATRDYFYDRRVVCIHCGFSKDWSGSILGFNWYAAVMRDPYFGFPLKLQTPCCGHTLWAYNLRHLNLIEGYVGATLRGAPKMASYHSTTTLPSALPEWMIVAKHRDEVLKAIAKIKVDLTGRKK